LGREDHASIRDPQEESQIDAIALPCLS